MGKKRSFQWQAVPDEAGATDYKTYPNEPLETDKDDQNFSEVMEGSLLRWQSIPPDVLAPAALDGPKRSEAVIDYAIDIAGCGLPWFPIHLRLVLSSTTPKNTGTISSRW